MPDSGAHVSVRPFTLTMCADFESDPDRHIGPAQSEATSIFGMDTICAHGIEGYRWRRIDPDRRPHDRGFPRCPMTPSLARMQALGVHILICWAAVRVEYDAEKWSQIRKTAH